MLRKRFGFCSCFLYFESSEQSEMCLLSTLFRNVNIYHFLTASVTEEFVLLHVYQRALHHREMLFINNSLGVSAAGERWSSVSADITEHCEPEQWYIPLKGNAYFTYSYGNCSIICYVNVNCRHTFLTKSCFNVRFECYTALSPVGQKQYYHKNK